MKLIQAEEENCVACYICGEICPMFVIAFTEEGYPVPKQGADRLCINCGYCVDACPTGALKHRFRKRSANINSVAIRKKLQEATRQGRKHERRV